MATFRKGISVEDVNREIGSDNKHESWGCGHFNGLPLAVEVIGANSHCYGWGGNGWGKEREGYAADGSFVVFRDEAGRFWTAWEESDSTGHGCQCDGGYNGPHDTLDSALMLGLSRDQREGWKQAGYTLPEGCE